MKTFLTSIIAAIVGSIITALIPIWLQSNSAQSISASVNTVTVPFPAIREANKPWDTILSTIEREVPNENLAKFLQSANVYHGMNIIETSLSNTSDTRTKEIRLSINQLLGYVTLGGSGKSFGFPSADGTIVLGGLDPEATVRIIGLAPASFDAFDFFTSPVRVMNGDRKVEVTQISNTDRDSPLGLARWLRKNPAAEPLIFAALAMCAMMIAFTTLFVAAAYNDRLAAALMSRSEMPRIFRVIEYIQKHHPEKLPESYRIVKSEDLK